MEFENRQRVLQTRIRSLCSQNIVAFATILQERIMSMSEQRKFFRLKEVCQAVGLQKTAIYNLESKGLFPARVHLGLRSVAWHKHEVEDWLATRPRVRL
jgi:prophage regulatory protein